MIIISQTNEISKRISVIAIIFIYGFISFSDKKIRRIEKPIMRIIVIKNQTVSPAVVSLSAFAAASAARFSRICS